MGFTSCVGPSRGGGNGRKRKSDNVSPSGSLKKL